MLGLARAPLGDVGGGAAKGTHYLFTTSEGRRLMFIRYLALGQRGLERLAETSSLEDRGQHETASLPGLETSGKGASEMSSGCHRSAHLQSR